jgi:cellulose synthase/poly-beta-1,6-N-acetylglucosamine synthase-like glycosyltransferase
VPDPRSIELWIAGTAAIQCVFLLLARARYNSLRLVEAVPGKPQPDCMVVIPARNEEAVIARAVGSFPPDTVIVVDDHSDDGTAEAARKAGAGVIPAPPLPRFGLGKPNACAAGARALDSRWVLFTDADTWFEEGFLPAAVACAEANGLSLLSLYLRPEYETFAERVLAPYARALFFSGVRSKGTPNAMFNGQCVLARREPYLFMGGHGAVVTHLADDVRLTSVAERHRMKIAVARCPSLGHARMYAGWVGICRGIERQASRFMVVSSWMGVAILATAFTAALWLPSLAWLGWERHWAAFATLALLPFLLLAPWYRGAYALLAPFAIYGMLPVLALAVFSAVQGRTIVWKGRRVRTVS